MLGQQRAPLRVALATASWPVRRRPVTRQRVELRLDHRALLLDRDDLLEAAQEIRVGDVLERPDQRDLAHADAEPRQFGGIETEHRECLAQVAKRLAGGDEGDPLAALWRDDGPVERVGARERLRRGQLEAQRALVLRPAVVGLPAVEAACWQFEVVGQPEWFSRGGRGHQCRALDDVRDQLEAGPQSAVARHGETGQSQFEQIGDVGRVEHRRHCRDQRLLALIGDGRRRGCRIVAGGDEHAAEAGRAVHVGVLEHVADPVEPRVLAVPQREHALAARPAEGLDLLGAPHRGCGEFLVQAGLEADRGRGELAAGTPHRQVDPAEWRAAIAGHESRRIQPGGAIERLLSQHQVHQRVGAGAQPARGEWRRPGVAAAHAIGAVLHARAAWRVDHHAKRHGRLRSIGSSPWRRRSRR